jgi:diadenylate cyclase
MTESILNDGWQFFVELFNNLRTGVLFFGGPFDIVLAILDIFITTLVIYFILKLIRDSRAWQLLKGIVLIVIFSQVFTLLGLQTIGYILTNTLSILAIAFVVLFQPELRRALETVGRSSFTILSGVVSQDDQLGKNVIYSMIDSIVIAAEKLTASRTGALIIIERETKLGELTEQDNAVIMDSAVSSTLLLQIFYKGSPLHDGAVLIRNGRINAARCHVPLSDNYHLRKDYGTRHRAAIGVSEMGDAIAVVVSEETGVISVAVNGRLYPLDNPDALRAILHKQLDVDLAGGVISHLIKNTKSRMKDNATFAKSIKKRRKIDLMMLLASLLIAAFAWVYIQITINPVVKKSFYVPVSVEGIEELKKNEITLQVPITTINIDLIGRSKNINDLNTSDISAIIDVSEVTSATAMNMPVTTRIKKLSYFKTTNISPSSIVIVFTSTKPKVEPTPTPTITIPPTPTLSPAASPTK